MKHPAIAGLNRLPESVYLGLGSNLGDRELRLREAIARLEALGLEITKASSIYETEPVDYANQPWFLNQAVEARVDPGLTSVFEMEARAWLARNDPGGDVLAAAMPSVSREAPGEAATLWVVGLLEKLLQIESEMGRERTQPNGPRSIDIDILIYGEAEGGFVITRADPAKPGTEVAGSPWLILPHPRMHKRRFVLEPLCEIVPDLVHPVLKKTCRELLDSLEDSSSVRLYKKIE